MYDNNYKDFWDEKNKIARAGAKGISLIKYPPISYFSLDFSLTIMINKQCNFQRDKKII